MLNHLTRYLLEYKTVSVPNVGTLCLVQQPPQLNVVDKLIEPPFYMVEIKRNEDIPGHQLLFLSKLANEDRNTVTAKLHSFGETVKQKMDGGGFQWPGLGTVTNDTETIRLSVAAMQPIAAERVIRQDAKHSVLVGDRHLTSDYVSERNTDRRPTTKRRTIFLVAGWILLLVSVLAIALLLYLGKFNVNAAGSKLPPLSRVATTFKANV